MKDNEPRRYQRSIQAFLASPGDTSEERECLAGVVNELNLTWADYIGVRIDLVRWETHSWPAAGEDAQQVINEQTGDNYEIFIAVLRHRIGSPTRRDISGTIEEFHRAHHRHKESGVPKIMFYMHADADAEPAIAKIQVELKEKGVLYWSYRDRRQFEQKSRIHLSRQVQKMAQDDRKHSPEHRTFPDPRQSDLVAGLRLITSVLNDGTLAFQEYIEGTEALKALTQSLAIVMQGTSGKLERIGRPGFRQPPGGAGPIVRSFARDLDQYASNVERVGPPTMAAYQRGVTAFSRALSVMAPLAPLPLLFRNKIETTQAQIGRMQTKLSELRSSAEGARQGISGWQKQNVEELNKAKRKVLEAMDWLDREITDALHVTRDVERTVEEFLDMQLS